MERESLTAWVARFVTRTRQGQIPPPVIAMARGFILDGLGVMLAGSTEKGSRIIQAHLREMGGRPVAAVVGAGFRAPVTQAAFANGASGHAMDYDDTQLSTSKEAVYGLLTHPTVPVLSACLALGEKLSLSGKALLEAYIIGVEVECRIADAINPRHYQQGFHSTATMGGLGGAAAAGKLLRLNEEAQCRALGAAASMAAGLRENFGTMTKPFHAGRAAENGILAALLARRGFTAARNILEAPRGFYNAMAGGYDPAKISGRLGKPFFIQDPGISIKPYPSGSLSHPAQDVILDMVKVHDLTPKDILSIEVGTNSNVPNALIHTHPRTSLEGKFSIPFCMAIAVLERKAGIAQFTDRKVRDPRTVALMKRVTLYVDPEMERLGYDQVRSIVRVKLVDGRILEGRADFARGMPQKPMSQAELSAKFTECAELAISGASADRTLQMVWTLDKLRSLKPLIGEILGRRPRRS